MRILQRKSILLVMIVMSLALTGCASKSEKSDGSSADSADSMMADAGENFNLELNGTSDENSAGPLKTIFFDFNSSSLSTSGRTTLEENATFLKLTENVDIQIEGHADERGGHQYNLALGERRARTVKDYIVALGVNEARVSIISYGKEKPTSFGHDEESWSKNRRATFVITAK
jgi:peptidoglycan-associated lipoprotein